MLFAILILNVSAVNHPFSGNGEMIHPISQEQSPIPIHGFYHIVITAFIEFGNRDIFRQIGNAFQYRAFPQIKIHFTFQQDTACQESPLRYDDRTSSLAGTGLYRPVDEGRIVGFPISLRSESCYIIDSILSSFILI